MMLLFKGIPISAAGPAPNYDMQRVLSAKNPREASMMSAWVNIVLTPPRYFLIIGLTVLAAAFFGPDLRAMGTHLDFELVLPMALGRFVPVGLLGFLIAGLLAAFMSNFAATVNAAPPYFVNDIYKRYINPNASPKTYVRLSYLASFSRDRDRRDLIGWNVTSVNEVVVWIVSGLWGGYTASNVLKWYWWRFNGWGYFWGMITGIGSALLAPKIVPLLPFVQDLLCPLQHQHGSSRHLPARARNLADRLPARHAAHQAGRRRSADGLLSPRAAVGLLGPGAEEGAGRRSRVQKQQGLLPRYVQHRYRHCLAGFARGAALVHRDSGMDACGPGRSLNRRYFADSQVHLVRSPDRA